MSRVDPESDRSAPEETSKGERSPVRAGLSTAGLERLVVEMAVIVVSVVLAFIVNEWRQDVARSATIATVLDAVREEVAARNSNARAPCGPTISRPLHAVVSLRFA